MIAGPVLVGHAYSLQIQIFSMETIATEYWTVDGRVFERIVDRRHRATSGRIEPSPSPGRDCQVAPGESSTGLALFCGGCEPDADPPVRYGAPARGDTGSRKRAAVRYPPATGLARWVAVSSEVPVSWA